MWRCRVFRFSVSCFPASHLCMKYLCIFARAIIETELIQRALFYYSNVSNRTKKERKKRNVKSVSCKHMIRSRQLLLFSPARIIPAHILNSIAVALLHHRRTRCQPFIHSIYILFPSPSMSSRRDPVTGSVCLIYPPLIASMVCGFFTSERHLPHATLLSLHRLSHRLLVHPLLGCAKRRDAPSTRRWDTNGGIDLEILAVDTRSN